MAGGTPRTLDQLAKHEVEVRSDYSRWCDGWDRICAALAQIAVDLEDELYLKLSAQGGNGMEARRKARRAVRPLRLRAAAAKATGRLGPRAYRHYQHAYTTEINASKAKKAFNHQA